MQALTVRRRDDETEAMRFDGTQEGTLAIRQWMRKSKAKADALYFIVGGKPQMIISYAATGESISPLPGCEVFEFTVNVGDFIVKGTGDNFIPMTSHRFRDQYRINT